MNIKLYNSSSYRFLKAVKETIIYNQMFNSGDKVLVAVSGGSDSIALFHVLRLLSDDLGIDLSIAHLDHRIRKVNSRRDALFVESIANEFNVSFYNTSANILKIKQKLKLSTEEAARKIRYAFFRKLIIEYSFKKVSLAHHMEDNAELVLMSMIRGTGSKGFSGMLPVCNKHFVRPFIRTKKGQILKFLSDEGLEYVEDESNNDLKFTRNKVRHCLIPLLANLFNPKIVDSLNRTALLISSENQWMNEVVNLEYGKALIECVNGKNVVLSTPILNKLNIAIKREVIRRAISLVYGSLKRITFNHIEAVIKLIESNSGNKRLCLPKHVIIKKIYDKIEIKTISKDHHENLKYLLPTKLNFTVINKNALPLSFKENNHKFNFSIIKFSEVPSWNEVSKNIVFLDLNFLQFPLSIHYALTTDNFNPLGMYGNQKLKKYFLNNKILPSERSNTLVVKDKKRIIWLVMHTICNYAKITKTTKNILKIEFYLLKKQ